MAAYIRKKNTVSSKTKDGLHEYQERASRQSKPTKGRHVLKRELPYLPLGGPIPLKKKLFISMTHKEEVRQ